MRGARPASGSLISADTSAALRAVGAGLAFAGLGDLHRHVVAQVARDRAVAAGDDLFALGHAGLDLDGVVALDAGGDLLRVGLAVLDHEDQFHEAILAGLVVLAILAELIRRAHGHRLDRHAHRLGFRRGYDVRARGHARTQLAGGGGDRDLHLELGLLRGLAGGWDVGAAGDLRNLAGDDFTEHRVHRDLGLLAQLDRVDVVLVDVDHRLHAAQLRDLHDHVFLELRTDGDFAGFLVEVGDGAGDRRVDLRLAQVVLRLAQLADHLRDLVLRRGGARVLDLEGRLGGIEFGLRDQLAADQFAGALEHALGLVAVVARQLGLGLRRAHAGLQAVDAGEQLLPVQLDQQLALLDVVGFLDGQQDDLRADVGADVDFGVRLDLAGAVDLLHDQRALGDGRFDLFAFALLALDRHIAADTDHDDHRGDSSYPSSFFHFNRPLCQCAHRNIHGAGARSAKSVVYLWRRSAGLAANVADEDDGARSALSRSP